jgi:uncharacterized protein YgiM (DUF1202 family)
MRALVIIALLLLGVNAFADQAVIVNGVHANLRSGKADNYRLLATLQPGTPVDILKVEQDYARIQTEDGTIGWLPERLLERRPVPEKATETEQAVEAAKKEMLLMQQQLSQAQETLERRQNRLIGYGTLGIIGLLALLAGIGIGMLLREAHYRKRLNGLRI